MKKFISIALSAVMLISAGAITAMPVMAATVSSPGGSEVTTKPASETEPVIITVNSNSSADTAYSKDGSKYTFNYTGDKDVVRWEFPNMIEGTDYNIISTSDDMTQIVIELTESGKQKQVVANAVVKGEKTSKDDTDVDDEDDDDSDNSSTKKDSSSTSPATGAAMAGIAMAGTGVAMLALSKKKKD